LPRIGFLVSNRSGRSRVEASLSGIDDYIPLIVIGIDARQDDGRRRLPRSEIYARLEGPMDAGVSKRSATPEQRADGAPQTLLRI
jgi:hypothetical protein